MTVKGNQPQLQATLALLFDSPLATRVAMRQATSREVGHGRIEERCLRSSTVWAGKSDWPGWAQLCRVERRIRKKKRGAVRVEVV